MRCNFHDRSAIAISGFAPSRACKRKARIGIRICVGTVECIPVGTSKRSARQRTPGGRRVDFPMGFSSDSHGRDRAKPSMKAQHIVAWVAHHNLAFVTETDPAGVGVMKTSAVIDEESDSLIKINYGAAVICIRLSCLRIS